MTEHCDDHAEFEAHCPHCLRAQARADYLRMFPTHLEQPWRARVEAELGPAFIGSMFPCFDDADGAGVYSVTLAQSVDGGVEVAATVSGTDQDRLILVAGLMGAWADALTGGHAGMVGRIVRAGRGDE